MSEFDARRYLERLERGRYVEQQGRVRSAVGLVVRATLPETWIGEVCELRARRGVAPVLAEVVGFRGDEALLMPLGPMREIGTESLVRRTGTTLTVRLTSDDTSHGFRIVGTDVNIEIPKRSRGTATVTFVPEKAGRYTFECSRLCGAGHGFMRGVIIASDPPKAGR